jgi:hypothetical protein
MPINEIGYIKTTGQLDDHDEQYDWLITEPTELNDIEPLLYQDLLEYD